MSIGALGTLPKSFKKWLDVLDMTGDLELLQRACLLGSAHEKKIPFGNFFHPDINDEE